MGTESIGDEVVWGHADSHSWETALPALDTARGKKISILRSSAPWVLLFLQMYPGDSPTGSEIPQSLLLILRVSVMARNGGMVKIRLFFSSSTVLSEKCSAFPSCLARDVLSVPEVPTSC